MTDSEQDRKKELKRQFKARERADAEARLPLEKSDLADLFEHLDEQLTDDECDHTFGHTEAFLAERGLNAALIIPWLRESGGHWRTLRMSGASGCERRFPRGCQLTYVAAAERINECSLGRGSVHAGYPPGVEGDCRRDGSWASTPDFGPL